MIQNEPASEFPFAGIVTPPVVALIGLGIVLLATAANSQVHIHSVLGIAVGTAFVLIFGGAMLVEVVMLILGAVTLAKQPSERTRRNLSAFAFGTACLLLGGAWFAFAR
jgi:hypothetical protein